MITINLTIHPKYNLGDTVFVDQYDRIDEAVVIDYMITTYLLEGKTELKYAYQVQAKKRKYTKYTVDTNSIFDTKQEAFDSLMDRRWSGYKGKTVEEIAEIIKTKWNKDVHKDAEDIQKEMKKIMKTTGINT